MRDYPPEMQERISEYVSECMNPAERESFADRLAGDAELRREVDRLVRVRRRLLDDPDENTGRDLTPCVLDRIRADNARESGYGWLYRVAAVLLVAVGLTAFYLYGRKPVRPVPDCKPGRAASGMAVAGISACKWLTRNQKDDGTWDTTAYGGRPEVAVGVDGLALLALLEHDEFRDQAKRAAMALLARQADDGCFGSGTRASMYNHGIASVALLKADRKLALRDVSARLDKAVRYIVETQAPDGGWGYGAGKARLSNLAVTVWQMQALREAAASGRVGAAACLKRGMAYVRSLVSEDKHLQYMAGNRGMGRSSGLDAMGAYCLLMDMDAEVRAIGADMFARLVDTYTVDADRTVDPYCLFFLARAGRLAGLPAAERALNRWRRRLADAQVALGPDHGSLNYWNLNRGNVGGRVYATAMLAVALQ